MLIDFDKDRILRMSRCAHCGYRLPAHLGAKCLFGPGTYEIGLLRIQHSTELDQWLTTDERAAYWVFNDRRTLETRLKDDMVPE
jgi:hypothetical protein